ncbi:MAG TPA: arginine--tRNA ligase [Candidatus Nanoarchaeia archaeon]|nr:arginine--tRNA ligase [Candidatus Nanoarchaeia archaeon]
MVDIRDIVIGELEKLSIKATKADLNPPKDIKNGDLSFFVKDKGFDIANLKLETVSHPYIEKAVLVGRFINFFYSPKYFQDVIKEINEDPNSFGKNTILDGEKVIIEFTDPNPFKPFHIGHLMSNSIGEAISRIATWSGAEVTRANYQGDVGPHVAKAIWGMMRLGMTLPEVTEKYWNKRRILDFFGLASWFGAKVYEEGKLMKHFREREAILKIGEAYVLGSSSYEEGSRQEIDEINKKIYQKSDPEINALYDWGRKVSLAHFEEIYAKLGTNFDKYFFESESAPLGMFVAEELLEKGILVKSDGAVVFKGEEYGLHTRVFINSQGLPTYETKELGLAKMKFDQVDYDKSIVITASEQTDFYKVFLKVLEFANPTVANKTRHISHGMMRFAEGKMSSRKGNVITGESLIADVEKLVEEKMKDRDLAAAQKREIMTDVAVGAIKYSILKQSPGKDIIFDFNKSLSFEGDSGPYIQYAHARINSVLRKAKEQGIKPCLEHVENPGELEHILVRFPEVVERAQLELAPQLIVTYLITLASTFNAYYANNVIIDKANKSSSYRLALAEAVKNTLAVGLSLIGIRAPEEM